MLVAKAVCQHIRLQLYQLMSYVERIIIGAVLILSAYTLYTGAQERHQFHSAIAQLSQFIGKCLGCTCWIEVYRQLAVLLVFTGGASLLMDSGVTVGIIAQLILTALDLTDLRGGLDVAEAQTLLVNVALLVFLYRNCCESCQKKEKVKAKVNDGKTENKSVSVPKADPSPLTASAPGSKKPQVDEVVKSTRPNNRGK